MRFKGDEIMGVYIKGMEMPKSCYACMFFAQTDYWNKEDEADILSRCKRTGEKTWESVNGYLPNCPLGPVPPHGDLIDRDALERDIDKYIGGEESRSRFHHWVQVQDAVIPMDKGEEK